MKHIIPKLMSVSLVVMLLLVSVSTSFAAEELKINDTASVNVGDKLKFTLYLDETKEDIIGFELRLFYDSEYLEFDKNSLESEAFDNLVYNPNIEGKIPMNWTDFTRPVSFSTKGEFFSCEFTALKDGDAEISYFVTEMYGDDMTYLKSYKWTYGITVNGEEIITDGVLPVSTDEETLNTRQSSFINYIDGMGEENSPNADNHESVVGQMPVPPETVIEQSVEEVTRYVEVDGDNNSSPNYLLWITIPVLSVLVIAAVIFVIMNNKKK